MDSGRLRSHVTFTLHRGGTEQEGFRGTVSGSQVKRAQGEGRNSHVGQRDLEASFCLTGPGILSERGISLSNRYLTHCLEGKRPSITPHTLARKEFIFRSTFLCTFYTNSSSSVKVCTHKNVSSSIAEFFLCEYST